MRYFILLLISGLLLSSCGRVNIARYRSYPDVMTIAKKLDADYKIHSDPAFYFTLAKKPKGWFVVRMDNKTLKPVSEELCWSLSSGAYEKIPRDFFNSVQSNNPSDAFIKFSREVRNTAYGYDHSIYFGYDGWEDDVIDEIGGAGNLNDTLLEALARAYGSKCLNLTRYEKAAVAKRSGKISDSQLSDFCKYGNKDIETYKRLLDLNPDYETIVGKAKTKLSDEYMFLWSELKQSGREKEAEQFLVDGLYDDLMINFAKNMLNSADKNGIIFTNGDNDTYPLWYVQEKLGVRKDIAVMNTSLMNIPSWIFSARDRYGFELKIPDTFYNDSLSDAIYLQDLRKDVYTMTNVKEGFAIKDPSFFEKASDGSGLAILPFKNIRLSFMLMGNDTVAPVVHLKNSYILKSDLAIMDIIASNLGNRPIYFAQTVSGTFTDGFMNNLCFEGMLAQVVPGENRGTLFQDKYYDLDLYYKNQLGIYNYGLDHLKSLEVEPIAMNYIYNFHSLSAALLEKGDTLKAMEVAEMGVRKIPFTLFTDPVGPFLIGDDLCHSGKAEEGHKLLSMSFEKIKNSYEKEEDDYEINTYSSILNSIVTDAEKFGFTELIQPATNLKTKVDEKGESIEKKREEPIY